MGYGIKKKKLNIGLIPQPLLPREKGCKRLIFQDLAPLPWERGWGEVDPGGVGVRPTKVGLGEADNRFGFGDEFRSTRFLIFIFLVFLQTYL